MKDPTIICPNCKSEIKLTESLAAPLIEDVKKQFQAEIAKKDSEISNKEKTLLDKEKALAESKRNLENEINDKVSAQLQKDRIRIAEEENKKVRLALSNDLDQKTRELSELNEILKQRDEKLAEAQNAQAELIKKQRELDDTKRELELTIEKRVQESLAQTREQAKKEVEASLNLKVAEKDQTIASMQQKIEDLKRRAEQGSQQLQGEAQEIVLEKLLSEKFPFDSIEPVPKGEHGGDIIQRVVNSNGSQSGSILWETKRTKNWNDSWLVKLRDDQRNAKADIAIIVSHTLPKAVESFDIIDNVWVTRPSILLPIATLLRQSLIEISIARQSAEGQQTKTELIYQYLTGPNFRHRIEAIVEAFSSMKSDLDKEKRVITKQWAKRESQIERVITSTVGMYGDLQGIAGKSLQEIEGLDYAAIAGPEKEDDKN